MKIEIILTFIVLTIFMGLLIMGISVSTTYKRLYRKIRDTIIRVKTYENIEELVRDIDVTYSPAVLSYLMNQEIEPQKDFLATILNLYAKKAINIEKIDGRYLLTPVEKSKLQLDSDEKYVYDIIVNDEKINFIKWNKYIINEYNKYGFGEKKSYDSVILAIISVLLTIPLAVFIYIKLRIGFMDNISAILLTILSGILIGPFIYAFGSLIVQLIVDSNIFLTDKGKKEIKKWMRFKKFIEDYSLIAEQPIESTKIWEKYIPYAMALDINKKYQQKEMKLFKQEELYDLKQFIDLNKYGVSFKTKLQNEEKDV